MNAAMAEVMAPSIPLSCEEVNLFSVGSALNTRAIGCVGSRVARVCACSQVGLGGVCSQVAGVQRILQVFSVPYCQSEEKKSTCLEKYGILARTDFIYQLFKIAKQNVSSM